METLSASRKRCPSSFTVTPQWSILNLWKVFQLLRRNLSEVRITFYFFLSGKKCTYGVKCKFYHPERANQSQLPVADELRAQRDRAKNFSPKPSLQDTHAYQPEHRYTSSTTPPLSVEDKSHRASPSEQFTYQRDSSSPRSQPNTSLPHCSSSDVDEAFSSMGSSMSRLYIQDSMERHHHSYSSGVPSCSLSHDDYSHTGSYNGNTCSCGGGFLPHQNTVYSQCRCCYQHSSHHYQPVWSSCPALPPHNGDSPGHFSEKQRFRQPSNRQTHSLTREPWAQGSLSDPRASSRANSPSSEQRTGLRRQLSTLFPQSAVEQVMNAYPHISDMSRLISLIQSYRTSH